MYTLIDSQNNVLVRLSADVGIEDYTAEAQALADHMQRTITAYVAGRKIESFKPSAISTSCKVIEVMLDLDTLDRLDLNRRMEADLSLMAMGYSKGEISSGQMFEDCGYAIDAKDMADQLMYSDLLRKYQSE